MIKRIVNALKNNPDITGWLVNETRTVSSQAFYVMQKRETTRRVETCEYVVTVYRRHGENNAFVGSSSFVVSHKLAKRELERKIAEAVFAAQFVRNQAFELVEGVGKRTWKEPADATDPFDVLDRIANLFFAAATPVSRFNALEAFHTRATVRILNANGVDLTKTVAKVDVEAIPSHDGPDRKVELIKQYAYKTVDYEVVRKDAEAAIKDVAMRYAAGKIGALASADVILRDDDVAEFFDTMIADYSFDGIYRKTTDKKIGDAVQKDVTGDALTIGWTPASKADAFDRDGVLLAPVKVVEAGILTHYYGSNQYAQYLGMKPTGVFATLDVSKGTMTIAAMKKRPHLEIIALSGIQIDTYSGYIGGEVRLGVWYDGKNRIPVSGFSFSGNIDKALSTITLSKETAALARYRGPKYVKLNGMEIL